MKVYDNGAYFTVAVYASEVARFNASWPGSSVPARSIASQFDKANGDLVDIMPYDVADQVEGPEGLALSQDAQTYGRKSLGLEVL